MHWLRLLVAVGVVVAVTGCVATVGGKAIVPPGTDPSATVRLTDDGFGIELGKLSAPTAIEIFIEPQCPYCARFEMEFGDQIAEYIDAGKLMVTYRPLTFLDKSPGGYSAKVSNALFLTVDADVSAVELQTFLLNLYSVPDPSYSDALIAQIARDTQLPSGLIDRIASGDNAVDTEAMDEANTARFRELFGAKPHTPEVYAKQAVTFTDDAWLTELVGKRSWTRP